MVNSKAESTTKKDLLIVGFLCNWCSYGGADTAGVCRFNQPTDLRIIRIPCTGRMDPLFVVKALIYGADGVLVSGCHPKDCHYNVGNFYARRRLEVLKRFLPFMGISYGSIPLCLGIVFRRTDLATSGHRVFRSNSWFGTEPWRSRRN